MTMEAAGSVAVAKHVLLLIGLIIHMFTALYVTRTLMVTAIKFGILKRIDECK